ncbi:MAG TPA: hypothetical protein VL133_09520 [Devosia sp.]|nr:hypothetical protein [Devosia sp.]
MTNSSAPVLPQYLVADAVERIGLLPVLTTALKAWWTRPRLPQELPASLRVDIGMPGGDDPRHPASNAEIRFHYR